MSLLRRIVTNLKALRQLGPGPLALYGWYRAGLNTGYLRWLTPDRLGDERQWSGNGQWNAISRFLSLPDHEEMSSILGDSLPQLMSEADEIAAGKVRLFGGEAVLLQLAVPGPIFHWTEYEKTGRKRSIHKSEGEEERVAGGDDTRSDMKFTWEHGRFGWAFTLGRAYHISRDERYAQAFWTFAEIFMAANPAYRGPHWISGQEAALRLIAFTFASQVFADSSQTTPSRLARLAQIVAASAARIPPTLAYARAQNNNHLLVEAAGLYNAGVCLPRHPQASSWRSQGWHWIERSLRSQIAGDGAYIQNSTNYHRLMLQAVLWVNMLAGYQKQQFSPDVQQRLAQATRWLLSLLDLETGYVPNLGPNDGAYILPLAACPWADYRPVLQAASQAFLGEKMFPAGTWDEMSQWLKVEDSGQLKITDPGLEVRQSALYRRESTPGMAALNHLATPHVLRHPAKDSWAYLRVASYHARPGHADQLHFDLWWRGMNIAMDAGTYRYNCSAPWNNALAGTTVHNTITAGGEDQMRRAGRFLWLDWAQGKVVDRRLSQDGSLTYLAAQHDGYRRLGVIHQRIVECQEMGWLVTDSLLPTRKPISNPRLGPELRLHWLMPDWPWEIKNIPQDWSIKFNLSSPKGSLSLRIRRVQEGQPPNPHALTIHLVRAGVNLYGSGQASPILGWASPTYGQKVPALSLVVETIGTLPVTLVSEWEFP